MLLPFTGNYHRRIVRKLIRILDISDMQNGFTRKEGNLYVQGAFQIIEPINQFLKQIKEDYFQHIIIVQDTHFSEEYNQSEESKLFPIHCEYGTKDWDLSIDVSGLKNTWYFTKNQFDMWSRNGLTNVVIPDIIRKNAYNNLFHFLDNPYNPAISVTRDDFFHTNIPYFQLDAVEVTIIGVASDYCNRFAMEGWLAKGASITLIKDLTKGLQKETTEIIQEKQYQQYNGRLRAINSGQFIKEMVP